jgi:hypothetical protein
LFGTVDRLGGMVGTMTNDQILFDKLTYIDSLERPGISDDAARAHGEALDSALRESVATKADVVGAQGRRVSGQERIAFGNESTGNEKESSGNEANGARRRHAGRRSRRAVSNQFLRLNLALFKERFSTAIPD